MDTKAKGTYRKMFDEGVTMLVLDYNLQKMDFVEWARSVFNIKELEYLHLKPDPIKFQSYVDRLNYRTNQLKRNVEKIRGDCFRLRDEVLVPVFGEIEKFQFPPSLRCHLSGAGTVSAFHRDGEAPYGPTRNTINAWIPLTTVYGSNSIYIETEPDGTRQPITLAPGEMLIFDTNNLQHGSYPNDTVISRVSFEIRFVPKDPSIACELGIYAKEP